MAISGSGGGRPRVPPFDGDPGGGGGRPRVPPSDGDPGGGGSGRPRASQFDGVPASPPSTATLAAAAAAVPAPPSSTAWSPADHSSEDPLLRRYVSDAGKLHEIWELHPFQTQDSVSYEPLHQNVQTMDDQFCTQQSVVHENVHTQIDENKICEEEEGGEASEDESFSWWNEEQFDPVLAEDKIRKEDEEYAAILAERKRQREDPLLHYEGETDIEDIFFIEEEEDDVLEQILAKQPVQKKVMKPGPTVNCHSQVEIPDIPDWAPSDDDKDEGFLREEDDDGFEALSFVQPKKRKSRAKKQEPRIWYDENRQSPEQQFMLKLCFRDVSQFREALCRLHITQVRNFHYHRNAPERIIVWCKEKQKYGCLFYMTASKIAHEDTFCIKKLHLKHTCPTNPASTRVNSKWLSKVYVDNFKSDPNTVINTIQDNAKKDFGVEVPKRMAYRVRTKARNIVLGDHKKQYHRIRDYLQTVLDKNPGSRCIVTTVNGPTEDQLEAMKRGEAVVISYKPRFHGLFYCVAAAKQGFLDGCRPFIGLDGCFVKLTTCAQILAATGRDGNNNIYPIAWAVVAKEDTENWVWFLEQLKEALGGEQGKFGYYTIMSDMQKGLLKAVSTVFPHSPQRFCIRHIYANFQTAGFRGEDLKKCMDNAAYAWTKDGFDIAMEELKKQCEPAWVWLSKIPVHTWARWAMDTNCKTDLICNNLSETFNRYILDVRSKPINTMLVRIYDKQMVRFDGNREGASKAKWDITPHFTEQLELMKTFSRHCIPKRADLGLWQVKSGPVTHAVDLIGRTCSCRKWDMSGLPCNHAVSAIYKAEQHPEDFVSDFFKKPMYLNSYRPVFAPMPQEHGWTKTNTDDIMPPGFKEHQKGRRQEKRRKGKFEVPKPKSNSRMATVTCSNCKLQGHKYTSCLLPLRSDLAIRKNNHKASRSMPPPGPEHAAASSTTPRPSATTEPPTCSSSAQRPSPVSRPSTAPRAPFAAPRQAPAPEAPTTGAWAYFTAGANAGVGRDAKDPPLAGISLSGPTC